MVLGGANTGVSLAISAAVRRKEEPILRHRRCWSLASQARRLARPHTSRITPATISTALSNGTATTIVNEGGKTWFFVTADYAFGTQLQDSAARVATPRNGGKVVGAVRRSARHTSDFASYVFAGAEFRRAGARPLPMRAPISPNALEARPTSWGITKTYRSPRPLLAFITDIRGARPRDRARAISHDPLVLGPQRQRLRAFAKRFLDKVGRVSQRSSSRLHYSATMT